jgi:hypothetical protein
VVRILLPTLSPFPAARAPAIQVARVAQSFTRRGHDVTLVTPAPSPDGPDLSGPDAGRLLAAPVLILSGLVKTQYPLTDAIALMGGLFLLGLVVLAFLPETRGQELPE